MKYVLITVCLAVIIGLVYFSIGKTYIPKGAVPVSNFSVEKYLGKWYEIARMDFRFEKNLNNVTANYSLNKDGNVNVLNSGYNYVKAKWEKAEGVAKLTGAKNVGSLKVSFFGPFYSGYNVIAIDPDYQYALVAGENLNYLWILSRYKTIPDNIKEKYLQIATKIGYDVNNLVWVQHNKMNNPLLDEK